MRNIFIFLLFVCLVSCQSRGEDKQVYEGGIDETETEEDAGGDDLVERKLIKEGFVEFRTENMELVKEKVAKSVSKYKAYVSNDQLYKTSNRFSNTIVIRVPSPQFDSLLNDVTAGVEKVDRKEINVKDVTEEFLDVEARVKTKKELEARYLALLTKANSISEILEIEKQIESLRSEIESVEGRLKYLESKVSFSTLTLTFYVETMQETVFSSEFGQAFANGWQNMIWFLVALTSVWPFLLITLVLFFVVWRIRKSRK